MPQISTSSGLLRMGTKKGNYTAGLLKCEYLKAADQLDWSHVVMSCCLLTPLAAMNCAS